MRRHLLLLILASPVVFGVGDRTFREATGAGGSGGDAERRGGRLGVGAVVAGLSTVAWLTGLVAPFTDVPNLAGGAATLMSLHLTVDYLRHRAD